MAKIAKKRAAAGGKKRPGAYVGLRAPAALKAALEASARNADRSLSSEAQFRLEKSFERQALLPEVLELAFGPKVAGLVLLLAQGMADAGKQAAAWRVAQMAEDMPRIPPPYWLQQQDNWTEDPYAFDQAEKAVLKILEFARPGGNPTPPALALPIDLGGQDRVTNEGISTAKQITRALSNGNSEWATPRAKLLGSDLTIRMISAAEDSE